MSSSFRRIVTGHDDQGMSIIRAVDVLTPSLIDSGDAAFQLVWATPTVPVDLNDGTDGMLPAGKTLHGGSVIRIVDMLPGKSSPLHRSYSIDYGIILSGRLELVLDDGSVTPLSPGDIVVQRATNHLWRNPSTTQICRIAFILIEAKPVKAGGRVLPEVSP
jgi:quercetin dioxygenase-like cupin family protein